MCEKCKTKYDKYIWHVDEIIDGVNTNVQKIMDAPYILPRWKRFLICVFPFMFKLEDYR